MSLITKCPACETMFRVVPDQLRISEGWVRCGHCEEVFDATAHFLQEPAPALNSASPLDRTLATGGAAADLEPVAVQSMTTADEPWTAQADTQAQTQTQNDAPAPPLPAAMAASDDTLGFAAEPREPSFLHDQVAPRAAVKRWQQVLWATLGLMLVVVLMLQLVIHERNRIVAHEPAAKPLLVNLCGWLNCEITPLQQMDSLVIDSSSFTKLRTDVYRLAFVVRNSAVIALAVPFLELTLTDSQDQPLLRRVIQPGELNVRMETLGAGAEWSGTLVVNIKASGLSERVAGYRLIAFYP